ncbi:MAG: hypothetical protein RLZZ28_2062 [Bacteroidota bacterium]
MNQFFTNNIFRNVFFLGLIFSFLSQGISAQDSTVKERALYAENKLSLKLVAQLDRRFSRLDEEQVHVWGLRTGVQVNNKYKLGIGAYFVHQDLATENDVETGLNNAVKKNTYIGTVFFEPFLLRKKMLEISLLFEAGYGNSMVDSSHFVKGNLVTDRRNRIFIPAGLGLSANFITPDIKGLHLLSYFGVNGLVGFRKTIQNESLKYNADGLYWSVGLSVFVNKVFTDLHGKSKNHSHLLN